MKYKTILIITFALMTLVQLYVPISMIWNQEDILNSGTAFRFKAAPVDPEDPFRGRYVVLDFDENQFEQDTGMWKRGETVFVHLTTNNDGFAEINNVSKQEPKDLKDYLKTTVLYPPTIYNNKMTIDYPFNRYYMEETKATQAEKAYWNSLRDTTKVTYAVVYVKNGEFALRDVMIDGVSLKELVEVEKEK